MSTLLVVGQGYVGLPMALRAVEKGFDVIGLDLNAKVAADLNAGVSHIDDVSDADVAAALAKSYWATTDPADISAADVVVVCVPTPLSDEGGPDLRAVQGAARSIGEHVKPGALVILESTTYPGTTDEVFAPLVTRGELVVGEDVFIAFSPERIDPGNPTYGVANTPKVVGGMTPECTKRACDFYGAFIDTVVPVKGTKEAETAKLLENTFRHVNIALVNEMVRFCQDLDIDLWESIDAASTKPFGFMAFRPGPGVGGHCIPVDPSYLSHRVKAKLGYAFRMVELAEEINEAAPGYVAQRVWRILNEAKKPVNGAKVLLLGVTYKPNIADTRESPAVPLANQLLGWGADVRFADPFVSTWNAHGLNGSFVAQDDVAAAAKEADVVVLLQPHKRFDLDAIIAAGTPVLDTRGVIETQEIVTRL